MTLNTVLDGRNAWDTWGGTSRSTPVAVGATALVYQAYAPGARRQRPGRLLRDREAHPEVAPPQDLGYDALDPGLRFDRRGQAVPGRLSAQARDRVPGRVAGRRLPRHRVPGLHAHASRPAARDTQTFTVNGPPATWPVATGYAEADTPRRCSFTSSDLSKESHVQLQRTGLPARPHQRWCSSTRDADLMVVRAKYPRSEFDANED